MTSLRVLWLCLLCILSVISITESANILYAVPFSSKSHYIMLKPIGIELARRGHNVTVITANRENNPPQNYRQVMVDQKEIWEVIGGGRPNVFDMVQISAEKFHEIILWGGGIAFTEMALNSTDIQKFLHEENSFDLVIGEQFYTDAFNILAHKYNAPLVLITTFGNCMKHNMATRNPPQIATTVYEFLDVNSLTNFWSRIRNLYFSVYEYMWWRYWFLDENEKLVKKYVPNLPEPVPSLYDVQKNVSLMLVNSHYSFDDPIAYLPNIVEIGGVHLSMSETKLPSDFQNILDSATDGVVYVNFGSNVRSSELPIDKKNAFLNVFRKLKQTVIWKWEEDNLPNKPDNLVIRKWMPQKEILAHPNVKVFIAHGGLIGTQEAIFNGVPIIGIPIYADQYNNLLQAEHHGFGKILEYHTITEELLGKVLDEVLTNDSYRTNAKTLSNRFKDRPISPLDTAIFWIEYVIRNNGAGFIKSRGLELSWIQYNLLDIYAFIIAVILACLFVIYLVIIFLKNIIKRSTGEKHVKKTVKNKKS